MSRAGDDRREMNQHGSLDDGAIDALLAGTPPAEGGALVSSFIVDVRAAVVGVPAPSAALAAAIASGVCAEPGQVAAASNASAPARWRAAQGKIKATVAGLSVAGKIAFGAGLAAAATTGAGVAGVLPGPVQHAMASAVDAVTPFEIPDPGHATDHVGGSEHNGTDVTTPDASGASGGDNTGSSDNESGDGDRLGVVTPTTEHHDGSDGGDGNTSTPTTEHHDGSDGGDGHESTPTTVNGGDGGDGHESTTTTTPHEDGGDGGASTPTTDH
jgi:hypothetical protein